MKSILNRIAALACACTMLLPLHAQAAEVTLPSGLTAEELAEQLSEENHPQKREGSDQYASAAVAVFQGDKILFEHYYGYTDVMQEIPADAESVYEWGSITKTLIWVSVMQLYEQGRIELDRDVRDYLPEGFFQHLSYDDPITMYHLMNHNAGWQESVHLAWTNEESRVLPLKEALQAIEPAQVHRPGEVTAYSNYGAAVAGYVVECITGERFCDYVHTHIFDVLGMEHTALDAAHTDNEWVYGKRAQMHAYRFSVMLSHAVDLGTMQDYIMPYPAGAATGTLRDLVTYAQALADENTPLFMHPETQQLMFTGTDFYGNSEVPVNCHGFWCTEGAVRMYGHNGATLFGTADMELDPVSKTGYVVMTNEPKGNCFLSLVPEAVMGQPESYRYQTAEPQPFDTEGTYLIARSTHRGMLRIMPYLQTARIAVPEDGKAERIGDGLVQMSGPGAVTLLGSGTLADGTECLELPSTDLLRDRRYPAEITLIAAYLLAVVAGIYLLRLRIKRRLTGRKAPYGCSGIMAAGEIARAVSLLLLVAAIVIYEEYTGGIPAPAMQTIGIGQLACTGVCAAAAVVPFCRKLQGRGEVIDTLLNAAGCVLPVIAIVYFEMYRFWNI